MNLKILHILPDLRKGGAERLVMDICHTMQLNNMSEARLITFKPHNDYLFASKGLSIEVVPSYVVPSFSGKWRIHIKELQEFIFDFQPDIIHSHLFESEMVLSQVDCGNALRVMHFHDNMSQLAKFSWKTLLSKKAWTNWYERQCVLRSWNKLEKKCAVAIAEDSYHYASKVLGQATPIYKVLNGINIERFRPTQQKVKQAKLCMIGSLVPKKNQTLAIQTVYALQQIGYTFELELLGDGPERQKLEALSKELNVEHLIHFRGNVDDPENYLHQACIYIHTAWYEPLGLVLLEAMAAETPIVCLDGKGNRDLIQHGVNGFIFQEQNANIFATQIITLWKEDALYREITNNAKTFVQDFAIETYCAKLMDIYQQELST